MKRSGSALISMVLLLGLVGCGGGGGGASDAPVPSPSNLVVAPGPGFRTYHATWTEPAGTVDGYDLETRIGAMPYGLPARFPSFQKRWDSYFDASVPELTDCMFRIRARIGSRYSAYSNEYPFRIGIAPAGALVQLKGMVPGGLGVWWQRHSLVADTLVVERGLSQDASVLPQVWTEIEGLPLDTTEFVDPETTEGTHNFYRVTYRKGSEMAATVVGHYLVPVLPARALQVLSSEGKTTLTWQNQSRLGQSIQVFRASNVDATLPDGWPLGTLPPTATSFVDESVLPGFYTYFIRTVNASGDHADSSGTAAHVPSAPGQPDFVSAIQVLPMSTHRALSPNGQWVFGEHFSSSDIKMITGGASGWDVRSFPGSSRVAGPWLKIDDQNRPHIAYLRDAPDTSGRRTLVHAWLAGDGWHTEDVVARAFGDSFVERRLTFTLDSSGNPHFLWATESINGEWNMEYAHKGGDGQWLAEALDPLLHGIDSWEPINQLCLALDSDGRPHGVFATGYFGVIHHVSRSDAGAWSWTQAATDLYILDQDSLIIGSSPTGALRVFAEHQEYPAVDPALPLTLSMIELTGGTWSAPVVWHRRQNVGLDWPAAISRGADRLALSYMGRVTLVDAAGASVTEFSPAFGNEDEAPMPHFDVEGRLVVTRVVQWEVDGGLGIRMGWCRIYSELP